MVEDPSLPFAILFLTLLPTCPRNFWKSIPKVSMSITFQFRYGLKANDAILAGPEHLSLYATDPGWEVFIV